MPRENARPLIAATPQQRNSFILLLSVFTIQKSCKEASHKLIRSEPHLVGSLVTLNSLTKYVQERVFHGLLFGFLSGIKQK